VESFTTVIHNAVTDKDITRVKNIIKKKKLFKGRLNDGEGELKKDIRDSNVFMFSPDDDLWLYNIIGSIAISANKNFNFNIKTVQTIQYTEYNKGQYYDWHVDTFLSSYKALTDRKLSVSLQLSDADDYEGGDLEISQSDFSGMEVRQKGTAIVFPSFLEHRVTPVTKGKRISLVSWVEGTKFC